MESFSVVRAPPVMRCSIKLSFHPTTKARALRTLETVVVYATNDHRSGNSSSWRKKRPGKKYSPRLDELGDISALYSKNVFVKNSNKLLKSCNEHINYYVEKKSFSEAEKLYHLMIKKGVDPDVYTYNTLMKGYSRQGNTDRVFALFEEMVKKRVKPNKRTFTTAIQAYTVDGDLEGAQSIFKQMKNTDGVEPDVYTYSVMLKACVTARDLETARTLFHEMNSCAIRRDTIAMSTMIDVYAECCNEENGEQHLKECRELMKDMESNRIRADKQTYSTILKLCTRGNLTDDAMKILNEMRCNGIHPDVVSYNTVLDGISKGKKLSNEVVLLQSSVIVKKMKKEGIRQNATSFTSLMNVALRVGDLHQAVRLFSEMRTLKVEPTVVTFGTMIKCYENLGDPKKGYVYVKPCLDLLKECEEAGMKLTAEGYTSLLSACAKASNLGQSLRIWKKMIADDVKPDITSYTAMINVCVSSGKLDKAVRLFNKMKTEGIPPDPVTYATMIKGYEKLGNPKDGDAYLRPCLDLLEECEEAGMKMSAEGYTSLLSACANAPSFDIITQVWNKMIEDRIKPNVFAYKAMINVCVSTGNLEKAVSLYNEMEGLEIDPTVITFGTMIKCYEKLGDPKNGDAYLKPCLDLLEECEQAGIKMDATGYTSLLSACANACNFDQALKIWNRMKEKKVMPDVCVYTSMINSFLSKDNEDLAFEFYNEMSTSGIKPDVPTYGTFMSYFERKKNEAGAEKIRDEMKFQGVQPDKAIVRILNTLGVK